MMSALGLADELSSREGLSSADLKSVSGPIETFGFSHSVMGLGYSYSPNRSRFNLGSAFLIQMSRHVGVLSLSIVATDGNHLIRSA